MAFGSQPTLQEALWKSVRKPSCLAAVAGGEPGRKASACSAQLLSPTSSVEKAVLQPGAPPHCTSASALGSWAADFKTPLLDAADRPALRSTKAPNGKSSCP